MNSVARLFFFIAHVMLGRIFKMLCEVVKTIGFHEEKKLSYNQRTPNISKYENIKVIARNKVEANLRENHVQPSIVGVFTGNPRRILVKNRKETAFPKEVDDPYRRILSGKL